MKKFEFSVNLCQKLTISKIFTHIAIKNMHDEFFVRKKNPVVLRFLNKNYIEKKILKKISFYNALFYNSLKYSSLFPHSSTLFCNS